MSDWMIDTRDQYAVDTDSRYPDFSDMNTGESPYVKSMTQYRPVSTYENKYQMEQQNIPSYYPCRCGACPMRGILAPSPRPKMQTKTIDERQRDTPSLIDCCKGAIESMTGGSGESDMGTIQLNATTIFIIFLFIVIACICYSYNTTISNINAQMKLLMQLAKK